MSVATTFIDVCGPLLYAKFFVAKESQPTARTGCRCEYMSHVKTPSLPQLQSYFNSEMEVH